MSRVVTSDFVKSVSKGAQTAFMKGLMHAPVDWPKYAMRISSSQLTETYPWLGEVAKPREWTDQRVPHDLSEYNFTVTNKLYEGTIVVERTALEDEQYGQIMPRAQSMGEAAAQYIDELVGTALMNGFSTDCYDSQYFFDNDHSEKSSGTQSNLGTSALSGAAVTAGIAEMRQFKDDQGRYLNISPDTMIVHPDEEGTAMEIIMSDRDPDNANNPVNVNKGRFKLVVTPFLTSGYWVLAKTSGVIKPAMWQERTPVEFTSDDSSLFDDDVYKFGVRFRGRAALTNWRLAYGSTGGN